MSLAAEEFAQVVGILEKIDQGLIHPNVPGPIGRFLRQYGRGSGELRQRLAANGLDRRADMAFSGSALGVIEVHSILRPKVSVLGFPQGEVAQTIAVSEQLGGLTHLAMWLKSPVASAANNLLEGGSSLRLSGDYRWTPPSRLTTGEARVEAIGRKLRWREARCLKAVSDDLARPPHALEYLLDYRVGPRSLKFFRSVGAARVGNSWQVLPALGRPRTLEVEAILPRAYARLGSAKQAMLLIYCEPWSSTWTIAKAVAIDSDGLLDHAITWADFQRELDTSEIDARTVAAIRESLRESGVHPGNSAKLALRRSLLPAARNVVRWLRGSA